VAKEPPSVLSTDGKGINTQSHITVDHFKRTTLPQILSEVQMRKESNRRMGRTGSMSRFESFSSLGNVAVDA